MRNLFVEDADIEVVDASSQKSDTGLRLISSLTISKHASSRIHQMSIISTITRWHVTASTMNDDLTRVSYRT
jgi:hypothetical protein